MPAGATADLFKVFNVNLPFRFEAEFFRLVEKLREITECLNSWMSYDVRMRSTKHGGFSSPRPLPLGREFPETTRTLNP
jgi:hypothetical protein